MVTGNALFYLAGALAILIVCRAGLWLYEKVQTYRALKELGEDVHFEFRPWKW